MNGMSDGLSRLNDAREDSKTQLATQFSLLTHRGKKGISNFNVNLPFEHYQLLDAVIIMSFQKEIVRLQEFGNLSKVHDGNKNILSVEKIKKYLEDLEKRGLVEIWNDSVEVRSNWSTPQEAPSEIVTIEPAIPPTVEFDRKESDRNRQILGAKEALEKREREWSKLNILQKTLQAFVFASEREKILKEARLDPRLKTSTLVESYWRSRIKRRREKMSSGPTSLNHTSSYNSNLSSRSPKAVLQHAALIKKNANAIEEEFHRDVVREESFIYENRSIYLTEKGKESTIPMKIGAFLIEMCEIYTRTKPYNMSEATFESLARHFKHLVQNIEGIQDYVNHRITPESIKVITYYSKQNDYRDGIGDPVCRWWLILKEIIIDADPVELAKRRARRASSDVFERANAGK